MFLLSQKRKPELVNDTTGPAGLLSIPYAGRQGLSSPSIHALPRTS
jgi:hypothetical protein